VNRHAAGREGRRLGVTTLVVVVVVVLLAGCAAQPAAPPRPSQPALAGFPASYYEQLLAQHKPVFSVDAAHSIVVIEVRRGGSLARLGHDHVVASHDVAGRIAPDEGRADLWLPLEALVVDEPALRAEAGFQTQPSADDLAGTRNNMLTKVLQAEQYPFALIKLSKLGSGTGPLRLRVDITLHGITRSLETHAEYSRTEGELSVSGAVAIDQSDFGIAPFAVLGGAIAVQDRLNVSYRIHALRIE
jgi:hypothetical protein